MSNECDVTVLVAVWNTRTYLGPCLDSLLAQTLGSIQVVCIDDASTDGSAEILDTYHERDGRIEVIHLKENHGQAYARNIGLKQARGRYIAFLDSDDWMSADCLQQAVQTFRRYPRTGCVLFRAIYYYSPERQEEYPTEAFEVLSGHEAFVRSLTWDIHGIYMVRADIHHRYPYDESAHAFSDDNTTRLHYLASEEVRPCTGIYYYRQRSSSVSHQFNLRRFDYLKANWSMKQMLVELHADQSVLDLYENHRWLNVIDLYMIYYQHRHEWNPADQAEALKMIRRAWTSIEVRRIHRRLRIKLGYAPFHGSWFLFRMQEELYFGLRRLFGR